MAVPQKILIGPKLCHKIVFPRLEIPLDVPTCYKMQDAVLDAYIKSEARPTVDPGTRMTGTDASSPLGGLRAKTIPF